MAMMELWRRRDLDGGMTKLEYIDGNLFSQDNLGNLVGVELFHGNEPYSGGGTVSANVIRADGETVPVTGTMTGNRASVILPAACYAVVGAIMIFIKVASGSEVATVGAFASYVYASSTDTVVDPGTIIPSITDLINSIQSAVDSIPPEYEDLVERVQDLRKDLYSDLLIGMPITNNWFVDPDTGAGRTLNFDSYLNVPIPDGVKRLYPYDALTNNNIFRSVCFYDANGNYISGVGQQPSTVANGIAVPDGAKTLSVTMNIVEGRTEDDHYLSAVKGNHVLVGLESVDGLVDVTHSDLLYGKAYTDSLYIDPDTGAESALSSFYTYKGIDIPGGTTTLWPYNAFGNNTYIRSVCFYGPGNNFLSGVSGTAATVENGITVPAGAKTLSASLNYSSDTSHPYGVHYLSTVKGGDAVRQTLGNSIEVDAGKVFGVGTVQLPDRKPCFVFQFDDGTAGDINTKALFDSYGFKCCFSIVAGASPVADRYLEYQSEGFEILSHSVNGTAFSTISDLATVEDYLKTSKARLTAAGFDVRGFVTPSSYLMPNQLPLVKKYYQYGFGYIAGSEDLPYHTFYGKDIRQIERWSLESHTVEETMTAIQNCIDDCGFMIFYGHAYPSETNNMTTENMATILSYLRGKVDAGDALVGTARKMISDYYFTRHSDVQELDKKIDNESGELNDKVVELKSAFVGGTTGQLLRKKSNSDFDFEWSNVGQPTDAQTAAAVSDWLDEHPEATTTVQDKSLTVNKFVNGTLGYVTPEMYGAVGDGVTDDSVAVQAAFDSGFNVILTYKYFCRSTVTIHNAAELTISGINYNNSQLLFGDNAQLVIGGNTNVNELRMNNLSIVGNRTQVSVLKIQYVTNVTLNQVNIAEGGTYLVELDHADIVFIDGCTFAGSNVMGVWWPCAGIKMTSANPVYITNCNVWNVTNAFEIIGVTRTVNLTRNWIEFVNHVVHASGITMQNCNIEIKENNIVFSPHGSSPSFVDSRIVYLNNITPGFDILIDVIGNYINYYTAYPTQALVELINVPSYVLVNILKNNMFTRLQQMSAYALKVDAKRSTKLNYESTTNADRPYGCATAGITDTIKSPTSNNIMNLNIVSDQKDVVANRTEGDIWWEDGWLYIQDSSAVRSVAISQSEAITNITDPDTVVVADVAKKLNALMNLLRRTRIVR